MRLTREKVVRISHQIIDLLVQSNDVEFIEDRDTIRQHMVQTMTNILKEEEKVEVEVRKRITSQKKEILEGSEEWDVLFRKYYSEELRRMGIASASEEHQKAGHR
jgi:uncharacterized protein